MNVTNYNDSLAGAPSNGEQPSGTNISSTQGQSGPGAFVSSPSEDPRALTCKIYSVKGENQVEKFVDISVMKKIIKQGTDGFVSANYYTKSIASHHLVVHNQKQLDFVNWQIGSGYIGENNLVHLEQLFKPKNIENLPISLTRLKLNYAIDLSGLKKILEHLPKLEEIEFREIEGGFVHLHPELLSNFKKNTYQ